jgi:hypothetical protein
MAAVAYGFPMSKQPPGGSSATGGQIIFGARKQQPFEALSSRAKSGQMAQQMDGL